MYYTDKIINPTESIEQILAAIEKFDKERFLYALQYKNWDEAAIDRMASEVSDYRVRLKEELQRLADFANVFNNEFATDDNKCFDSALTLLKKLRSGMSETKRIFMKFCPRAKIDRFTSNTDNAPRSAFQYSFFSTATVQLDAFEFEGYPECVRVLYNEIGNFFIVLEECLKLCQYVLEDEKRIRNDHVYCTYLYKVFKEKFFREICDLIELFDRLSEVLSEKNNPAIASRNKYDNDEEWAHNGFHNFGKKHVKHLVVRQVLDEKAGNDLTVTELQLFGNNVNKVHRYREIIKHFDDLLPENYTKQSIGSKMVLMFLIYAEIPHGLYEKAVAYFNEMYKSSEANKHYTVGYPAVMNNKKRCEEKIKKDQDDEYRIFISKIENRNIPTSTIRLATNF